MRVHLPVDWLPLSSTMSIRFLSTDHDHKGTMSTSLTSNVRVYLSADRECLDRLHTDSAGFSLGSDRHEFPKTVLEVLRGVTTSIAPLQRLTDLAPGN